MDERARFWRFVGIITVILFVGTLFVIYFANGGIENWGTLLSAMIVVTMAAIALIVARMKLKDLRNGIPSEDERSSALKMRAGYLAFFISVYFLLGMGFLLTIFEDNQVSSLPTAEWFMICVAVMGSIYLVLNAYITRKGAPR